jgi:CubicO group peptidase (beta-lactamase class C family)
VAGNDIDDVCHKPPFPLTCAMDPYKVPCHAPGPAANYSNWGYSVLGELLARNAGANSWIELLRAKLLAPYGMTHSIVDGEPLGSLFKAPEWANCSATSLPNGPVWTTCDWQQSTPHPLPGAPSGGLWSTGPDMLKYLKYALGLPADAPSPEATALLAARPAIFCTREGTDDVGIGLGWYRRRLAGETTWSKDGDSGTFEAYMLLMPSHGSGVFALSNTNSESPNGGGIAGLARALLSAL